MVLGSTLASILRVGVANVDQFAKLSGVRSLEIVLGILDLLDCR